MRLPCDLAQRDVPTRLAHIVNPAHTTIALNTKGLLTSIHSGCEASTTRSVRSCSRATSRRRAAFDDRASDALARSTFGHTQPRFAVLSQRVAIRRPALLRRVPSCRSKEAWATSSRRSCFGAEIRVCTCVPEVVASTLDCDVRTTRDGVQRPHRHRVFLHGITSAWRQNRTAQRRLRFVFLRRFCRARLSRPRTRSGEPSSSLSGAKFHQDEARHRSRSQTYARLREFGQHASIRARAMGTTLGFRA